MRGAWCAWWAWLCVVGAAAELVFHVPEVLVRHAAADRPVGTGPRLEPRQEPRQEARQEPAYEEYFVEHDISAADARAAAEELDLDSMPDTLAGCGPCSRRELHYCETNALADHCCCERRYLEPFPWLPHTCYAGPKKCKPIARDCANYVRLRACCCDKKLAAKWKAILANSVRHTAGLELLLIALVLSCLLL